jgi:hypothetical protein
MRFSDRDINLAALPNNPPDVRLETAPGDHLGVPAAVGRCRVAAALI